MHIIIASKKCPCLYTYYLYTLQHTYTTFFFRTLLSHVYLPYTHDDGANVPTDSWTVVFSKYCSSFVVQGHNITYLCTCMHARLMVEPNTILSLNTGVLYSLEM